MSILPRILLWPIRAPLGFIIALFAMPLGWIISPFKRLEQYGIDLMLCRT